jgi:hypothetical protein
MTDGKHTAPVTGRDSETEIDPGSTFNPDDAWVNEFEKQLTHNLLDRLRNYARPRAFAVAAAGRKVDDFYTRELVQDAIGDTWSGVLRWDPTCCSLEFHLLRAVQSRTDKHRKHAKENPHDALGDATIASLNAEQDASNLVSSGDRAERRVFARETMEQLRAAAKQDKQILRVLAAYDAGAQTKDDVLAHARMNDGTYHKAHIRLKRMVRKLTDNTLSSNARA